MKSFEYKIVQPLVHDGSQWPYMTAKCCGSRVNHAGEIREYASSYGDRFVTHVQERSCKCGKTVLVVEGQLETCAVRGCFAFKKPTPPQGKEE